jgi:uncharacterized protein involved in exopolysaccharide biosynthesis
MQTLPPDSDSAPVSEDRRTSAFDLAVAVLRERRLIVTGTLVVGVLAAIVSLLIPPTYTAIARIFPPQQSQSSAAAILGHLATGVSASAGLIGRTQSDLFASMVRSRTVADELIEKFKLKEVYGVDLNASARLTLGSRTSVTVGKEGIISIAVDDRDPQRAAALADAYVSALDRLSHTLSITEASQRRLFFERQLSSTKEALVDAEARLVRFQQKTGLIAPASQASASLGTSLTLRAQITAREIELEAAKTFGTDANPEIRRLKVEIDALRRQLAQMEKTPSQGAGDVLVSLSKVPESTQEFVSLSREVRYRETLLQLLLQQYEAARLDEAKNAAVIQIIDKAEIPELRSWPKRTMIVLLSAVIAAVFLTILVCAGEYLSRLPADAPYQRIEEEMRKIKTVEMGRRLLSLLRRRRHR